jgi:hypothetical protein
VIHSLQALKILGDVVKAWPELAPS